jgi:hypothetical protein
MQPKHEKTSVRQQRCSAVELPDINFVGSSLSTVIDGRSDEFALMLRSFPIGRTDNKYYCACHAKNNVAELSSRCSATPSFIG